MQPAPGDTTTGMEPKYAIHYLPRGAPPPASFANEHEEAVAAGAALGALESAAGAGSSGPQPQGAEPADGCGGSSGAPARITPRP